jgi:drug/metabolite transporter (DMT)-like permease
MMRPSTQPRRTPSNDAEAMRSRLAAVGAAVLFGCGAPAAKGLLESMEPTLLAGLLYLGAGIALGTTRLLRGGSRVEWSRRDLAWLAGAIALGGIIAPLLLLWGLSRSTAASASLVLVLEAPLTALFARLIFREHVGPRATQALIATVAGAAVIAWPSGDVVGTTGLVAVAAACACWALDNTFTREVAHTDPVVVVALKGSIGGSINLAAALALGSAWPAAGAVLGAMLVGAVTYGASLVLYLVSLRGLGATRATIYFATAPFVGAVAGIAFLAEPPTIRLAAAAAMMAVGVWRLTGETHGHRHRHDPLEHSHPHTHDDDHHRHLHADGDESALHAHRHRHEPIEHEHPHVPDIHHRHGHR